MAKETNKGKKLFKRISIRTKASANVTDLIDLFDEENPTKKSIRELRKSLSVLSNERFPKGGLTEQLKELKEKEPEDESFVPEEDIETGAEDAGDLELTKKKSKKKKGKKKKAKKSKKK